MNRFRSSLVAMVIVAFAAGFVNQTEAAPTPSVIKDSGIVVMNGRHKGCEYQTPNGPVIADSFTPSGAGIGDACEPIISTSHVVTAASPFTTRADTAIGVVAYDPNGGPGKGCLFSSGGWSPTYKPSEAQVGEFCTSGDALTATVTAPVTKQVFGTVVQGSDTRDTFCRADAGQGEQDFGSYTPFPGQVGGQCEPIVTTKR